jgi:hypothetical protein
MAGCGYFIAGVRFIQSFLKHMNKGGLGGKGGHRRRWKGRILKTFSDRNSLLKFGGHAILVENAELSL